MDDAFEHVLRLDEACVFASAEPGGGEYVVAAGADAA